MNVEELEAHLIELKSKEMNTRGVLRKLLQAHCRFNNVDRALQIKKASLVIFYFSNINNSSFVSGIGHRAL